MNFKKTRVAVGSLAGISVFLIGLSFAYGISTGEGLKASPEQFDFGTIAEGTPAVASATIQNIGKMPVAIINLRTN
jgi:hypothetical protein